MKSFSLSFAFVSAHALAINSAPAVHTALPLAFCHVFMYKEEKTNSPAVRVPNQKDNLGCWRKRRGKRLAQQLSNLFCDTNQQLHTTKTAIPLGKRHSDMVTCSTVPGYALLAATKSGIT